MKKYFKLIGIVLLLSYFVAGVVGLGLLVNEDIEQRIKKEKIINTRDSLQMEYFKLKIDSLKK